MAQRTRIFGLSALMFAVAFGCWWLGGFEALGRSLGLGEAFVRSPEQQVGPKLRFPEVIELGVCEAGKVLTIPIEIANDGDRPLRVSNVRTNCNCSGLESQREDGSMLRVAQFELAVGEKRLFHCRLMPPRPSNQPQLHVLILKTNDPARPEAIVRMRLSEVRSEIVAVPSAGYFGRVPRDEARSMTISLWELREEPRDVLHVESSHPNQFSVAWRAQRETITDEHNHVRTKIGELTVELRTQNVGKIDGHVLITFDPALPPDRIPINGEVLHRFTCIPPRVFLAAGNAARSSATVTVHDSKGGDFEPRLRAVPAGLAAEATMISSSAQPRSEVAISIVQPDQFARSGQHLLVLECLTAEGSEIIELPVFVHVGR